MTPQRRQKVKDSVARIREFHRIGRTVPETDEDGIVYGKKIIDAEAKRIGLISDTVRKARQFANPVTGYSVKELNDLCHMIIWEQSSQGDKLSIFSCSHVKKMLTVAKKQRRALQREAIKNGWSYAKLKAEIALRFGTRRAGGRRRQVPKDLPGLLAQMEGICEQWRRWHRAAFVNVSEGQQIILRQLPELISERIKVADSAIKRLHEALNAELSRKNPKRKQRIAPREGEDK